MTTNDTPVKSLHLVFALLLFDPAGKCSDVTIVSRSAWGAAPADKMLTSMALPVKTLVIHHTGYPACHSGEACQGQVHQIQQDDKKHRRKVAL